MSEPFLTVERAAERLQVHAKTVLRFIHDGRLRATRIGKAWRILPSDLESFAGGAADNHRPPPPRVTCIAEVSDIGFEAAQRIASALQASLIAQTARPRPIQLDTVYDPERRSLKVIVIADALDAAALLRAFHAFTAAV